MISRTVERVSAFCSADEILIVTVAAQVDAVARELQGRVPPAQIVGEPEGKNTASSVGLAASLIEKRFGDLPFLVVPADHVIESESAFSADVLAAEEYVGAHDCLLTFGIRPSRPETGYGYIRAGRSVVGDAGVEIFEVESFHEKPAAEKAKAFVESGDYFWNSGLFAWRPSVILRAIADHLPDLARLLDRVRGRPGTDQLGDVLKFVYERAPAISIDHGVMEKADNAVMLRARFGWNDVGSWESVREVFPGDGEGNVLVGDHVMLDARDNTVFSPDRVVAVIGVSGVVVVDGGDAILVCRRDCVQQVRDVVEELEKSGKTRLV
jgi:mannose-1-phosphate guanylyltransferase